MSFTPDGDQESDDSAVDSYVEAEFDIPDDVVAAGLALHMNTQAGQQESVAQDTAMNERVLRQTAPRTITRSRIKRRPARIARRRPALALPARPTTPQEDSQSHINSELRDWLKVNASLLSNASLLISISALALKALPANGVLNPYIQALIFAAALTLLVEMHHQWPEDLQLHMFRRASFPRNHSRRMTSFAILMQLATVLFAVWATLTNPLILFPLAAFAIFLAFRQWYFPRFSGWPARILGVVLMLLVLLTCELLMLIVYASFVGGHITIIIGDRPAT
ncbi:MAG: hypothetical protein U0075_11940 [Thermomicrobiales bacterium]